VLVAALGVTAMEGKFRLAAEATLEALRRDKELLLGR